MYSISRFMLLGSLATALALANPITITLSGIGSGQLGSKPFSNSQFLFTLTTDTNFLNKPPCCNTNDTQSGTPATFAITGAGSGKLTGDQVIFAAPSDNTVGLAHFNDGDLIDITSSELAGFSLTSSIGPVTAAASLIGRCPGADCTAFSTNLGALQFSSVGNVTFTATVSTPQAPTLSGVVNGASFLAGIQNNTWITVQGANLSSTSRPWNPQTEIVNGVLPTMLDGVSATVNGKAAVVYYISPTQLNLLAPADDNLGPVEVTVKTSNGTSTSIMAELQKYSPALFLFDQQARKYPAALIARADGGVDYLGPDGLFGTALATRPVEPTEIILLYGTGFGPTDPVVPFGSVFSGAANLTGTATARIGNVPATVQFAGISGAGLYQFNVVVPALADGDQKVVLSIGGLSTQDNVYISVKN